ncbi:hypothetical protein GQ600_22417 [Phytophthora cactorum]|nr:hypothetical protein GQ600_22417 [Phytophthora cactorum]
MHEAGETVSHHGRQIEDLKEEVLPPRGQGQGDQDAEGDANMIGKAKAEISEEEWKAYFLAARRPEVLEYGQLAHAKRALTMDVFIPDAESRVMKMVAD